MNDAKEREEKSTTTDSTTSDRKKWRRIVRRIFFAIGGVVSLFLVVVITLGWTAFGTAPTGERLERMKKSPLWADGVFHNPRPLWNDIWGSMTGFLSSSEVSTPLQEIGVVTDTLERLKKEAGPLRVTWLGHSTTLIEIEGLTVLTDPVFGERTSPVGFMGPERFYAPPIPLDKLPHVDVVVISHDHYDHLDAPTITALAKVAGIRWLAPLGVGAHLEYWGVDGKMITESEWGESVTISNIEFVCAPSRHASGRQALDQNRTLWAGWAMIGSTRRLYYSGDTGFFPEFKDFGDKYGPFDLVMMEAGAYNKAWPDWHIGPEQAVQAHRLLRGKRLLPIHWGLFDLAMHGWTEPMERVLVAAKKTNEVVLTPRPGEPIDVDAPNETKVWWPKIPWETAEQAPIVSRGLD